MDAKQLSEPAAQRRFSPGVMSFMAAIILAMSAPMAARAQTVITSSTCDASDFQTALDHGGLITFASDCTISTFINFTVSTNVTIDGTGHKVVIDGGGTASGLLSLKLGVSVALNHVTLQNSGNGSALAGNGGTLIVTNCAFLNNNGGGHFSGGGAISIAGGSLTVLNSTFSGNRVSGTDSIGGAIASDNAAATIINSTFSGNSAPVGGGGAIGRVNGTVTAINTILAQNTGGNCGNVFAKLTDGGYNLSDDDTCGFSAAGSKNSDPNINLGGLSNGVFPPNSTSDAIDYLPTGTNGCATTVTSDQIGQARPGSLDGKCTVGAYEVVAPVSATITDCADDNQVQTAVGSGGRIVFACSGDISLSKTLTITQNTALDATGQIVTLDGHKSVQVLDVNPNFLNPGPVLTLNNLTIANGNTALGGGLYVRFGSAAVITNSTFSGNTASLLGGGIDQSDATNLIVTNSTFAGNSSASDGGGAMDVLDVAIVTNTTFTGNSSQGIGGAIKAEGNSSLLVQNSTFAGNTAPAGGGVFNSGAATFLNSLFVNNGGGDCRSEANTPISDGGYNLDDDGSCGFSDANHSFSDNPNANLGALSNNGGPTLTMPLLSGSAAIDAIPLFANGCGTTILTDQRGVARPQGPGCDIGASENALNQIQVTFNTNPAGPSYFVGPSSYTGQQVLTLPVGTQSTLWASSPQGSSGTQYTFASWSDSGAQAHIIPIPGANTTYTASFNVAYLLTTAVNPSGAGTVTPPSGQYYAAGSQVPLTATPNSGYGFSGWTGTVTSASNPLTVTMNSPVTETANFAPAVQVTVATNPSGLSFSVDGTPYQSAQTLTWTIGSKHTIASSSPQTLAGLQYGFASWSDGGAISHQVIASTSTSYTAKFNSFTITPNPAAETVNRGNIAAFILSLKSVNGFSGNVKLSCSGGPAGSYCVDFPMTVHLNGTAYAISGIFFPKNTKPGTYTVTFTGVSGALTNTATAKFTVK